MVNSQFGWLNTRKTRIRPAVLTVALIVIVGLSGGLGLGVANAAEPSLQEPGEISGTITAADGGTPLAGEQILLYDDEKRPPTRTVYTDSDGRYAFADLVPGYYGVAVNDPRFFPASREVFLGSGETLKVDFTLQKFARISGTVRLAGRPSQSDEVHVSLLEWTGGSYSQIGSGKSNAENGRFEFDRIAPGTYILEFDTDVTGYFPTYSGGVTDREEAERIEVTYGADIEQPLVEVVKRPLPTQTSRVAGADRYLVAVEVSKEAYPEGSDVVYLVTGENYPDALSAGPAAVTEDAPLLLTQTASLPSAVRAEIQRLDPDKVVIVGGPNSVSAAVEAEVEDLVPNTVRISGADRYEASRNVAKYAFGDDPPQNIYLATGRNFPDALSAGTAAGAQDRPVLLVDGNALAVDTPTKTLLTEFKTQRILIVGGPNSVGPHFFKSAQAIAHSVRIGGADRYAVSAAVNAQTGTMSPDAFVVTGQNFPDALSGTSWAGHIGAPLYVVPGSCVPGVSLQGMATQGVAHVTLIGGPDSLGEGIAELQPCP